MIFGILSIALVLRLISLNQSFWLDEATSATFATNTFSSIIGFARADFHPPLYYFILKAWTIVFGFSEVSIRMPSVLFGVGTVFLIYRIALLLFNKRTALVASVLAATAPLFVYYSQEARMYSQLTFLVTLGVYFFLKKRYLPFSLMLVLSFFTDYMAILIFPVFLLYPIVTKNKKVFQATLLSFIPCFILFLLWFPSFSTQLSGGLAVKDNLPVWWSILGGASIKQVMLLYIKFLIGRVSFDNNILYGLAVLPSLAISLYAFYKSRKQPSILHLWLILPVIFALIISLFIPIFTYFRMLFVLPAFYLLIAAVISSRRLILYIFLLSNLFFSMVYLLNSNFHREDWRGLVTFVSGSVYFVANSQMEAFRWYSSQTDKQVVALPPDELSQHNGEQLWAMRYVHDVFDPNDELVNKIHSLGYTKFVEYNFNGVVIRKYEK